MRLWRLTRAPFAALDGSGPELHGARWTSPGLPVVNFTKDAAMSVLIMLRYLPDGLAGIEQDHVLGWTDVEAEPERLPFVESQAEKRQIGDDWIASQRSLLAIVQSAVLPEADLVLLNPRHPDAPTVPPLCSRPFDFAQCLHVAKM